MQTIFLWMHIVIRVFLHSQHKSQWLVYGTWTTKYKENCRYDMHTYLYILNVYFKRGGLIWWGCVLTQSEHQMEAFSPYFLVSAVPSFFCTFCELIQIWNRNRTKQTYKTCIKKGSCSWWRYFYYYFSYTLFHVWRKFKT